MSVRLTMREVKALLARHGSVNAAVQEYAQSLFGPEDAPERISENPTPPKVRTASARLKDARCERCTRLNLDNPHCPACGTHK